MRRGVVPAVFVALSLTAAAFVACGLDESGTLSDGSVDVTTTDAGGNDVVADVPIDVPQACSTLDATACANVPLPDGWTYAVIATGDQACPTSQYAKTTYLSDPAPDGGCLCTCTPSGTLDCSGTVHAGTQANCGGGNSFDFDAGNDAACIDTSWNDKHISIGPLPNAKATNAQCDASAPAPAWSATTQTACTPNCSADYCGVGAPFQRCIIAAGGPACPAPFTKQISPLGTSQQVTAACTGCTCGIQDVPCGATVVAYQNTGCTQASGGGTIPTDGSCPPALPQNVNSFSYVPVVPSPTCAITASGTASAGFTNSITVCCLP